MSSTPAFGGQIPLKEDSNAPGPDQAKQLPPPDLAEAKSPSPSSCTRERGQSRSSFRDLLLLLALLIVTFAHSTHASEAFFEVPFVLTTRQTPALSTDLSIGLGFGYTHFPLAFYSFHLGYGALTTLSPAFSQGTKDVYTSGFDQDFEARSYLAYGFDGSVISFWPYIFLGTNANFSFTKVVAYQSSERVFRADFGFRGGAGIKIRVSDVSVKIDSAAGYGTYGLNLRTTIMFGFGIF